MPVMVVPQGMVSGVPVVYPAHHPQGGNPQIPQQPAPQPSQQDIQNLKDMFPNMEESVIQSVLEASGNNVDAATTHLLTMTDEDQANATWTCAPWHLKPMLIDKSPLSQEDSNNNDNEFNNDVSLCKNWFIFYFVTASENDNTKH